jgi:hypothetical protein
MGFWVGNESEDPQSTVILNFLPSFFLYGK